MCIYTYIHACMHNGSLLSVYAFIRAAYFVSVRPVFFIRMKHKVFGHKSKLLCFQIRAWKKGKIDIFFTNKIICIYIYIYIYKGRFDIFSTNVALLFFVKRNDVCVCVCVCFTMYVYAYPPALFWKTETFGFCFFC